MEQRKFIIVTDSGSDMSQEYFWEHDVECLQLGFTMDNVNYGGEEGEEIDCKEFYKRLRAGAMPTTYQVSAEAVKNRLTPFLQEGNDVLCLSFSSGLSGTYSGYVVAVRELKKAYPKRKIEVVDTLCASMGQGLLLDYVVRKADTGATIEETAAYAESLKGRIVHNFTVDNLFHLKRGGRVSSGTAIVGTILKIKPVMHVNDDGKLVVIGKPMGRKKALLTLLDNVAKTADFGKDDKIFISHADCADDAETFKGMLKERFGNVEIVVGNIGPVIGSHAGAGTLAVFHVGTTRKA